MVSTTAPHAPHAPGGGALRDRLRAVVADRLSADYADHPDTDGLLRSALSQLDPARTADQSVRWYGRRWAAQPHWHPDTRRRVQTLAHELDPSGQAEAVMITRADVFTRREDPVQMFLAAMAWGYGPTGYGCWRTAAIINPDGRNEESRVRAAMKAYHQAWADTGPQALAAAWTHGPGKIAGLGPAFASKIAYFALYDQDSDTPAGPLIADLNTAWALWALAGIWDSRHDPACYRDYIQWCQRWAHELNRRSDDIERVLFVLGPTVRRLYRQLPETPSG
jgi:hypothetical protein